MAGKTALLVIDVQTAMFTDGEPPHRASDVLGVIASLQDRARASQTPVIFVRHQDRDYEGMQPGHPGFEIHEAVAPLPGEVVIDKQACDSFCETPLRALLDDLDVGRVVIAGMQTDYCIDTACRSALHRGYDVVLAADGHSTWDNGVITAEQIIAHHNKALSQLPRPGYSISVVPGAEIEFAKVALAV
jgi:nicotinamidase-related amidase